MIPPHRTPPFLLIGILHSLHQKNQGRSSSNNNNNHQTPRNSTNLANQSLFYWIKPVSKPSKPGKEISNCEDHRDLCRKLKQNSDDHRPDICHQQLLALLDSLAR